MNPIEHLLLIDDSEATNNFHNRLLARIKFASTISICTNGKEGLDFLSNSQQCPDLIFLDLNMPVIDGFEFLSMVHSPLEKIGSQKPLIVILTSSEESVDKERCKNLYSNIEFYSKPLTIAQITELRKLFD
ncbi:MAG: CheY-like chemotaxis protein [Crocinitomix sp.]|jgi:CheY-like chemotaxis protein